MKTAEEWMEEEYENLHGPDDSKISAIKKVQLDAYKAGMTEAADIAFAHQYSMVSQVAAIIREHRDHKTVI